MVINCWLVNALLISRVTQNVISAFLVHISKPLIKHAMLAQTTALVAQVVLSVFNALEAII